MHNWLNKGFDDQLAGFVGGFWVKLSRVNLSVDREIWDEFRGLVPARQKSKIITELLREEVSRRKAEKRREALAQDFMKAAKDDQRWAEVSDWGAVDIEGWPE